MKEMILLFVDEVEKLKMSGLNFEIKSKVKGVFVVELDLPFKVWRRLSSK